MSWSTSLILERRAVGVRFSATAAIEARAKGEMILCAGSIGSVQVLHRSGIGPADWLAPLGIDVVLDKPGVGRNLQDHLRRAPSTGSGVRTLNETYWSLLRRGLMGLDYAFRRRGPLTMAPSQLGIFTRSDPDRERANIQFHVQPLSLDKFGDPLHRFPAITVSACNLRPTSRGTVRLRSTKLDEAPMIAPNYLATDEDRRVAADAIRTTRRLMQQPVLKKYRPSEYLPGPPLAMTMPRWPRPPATSAPPSSTPSAPPRWGLRATLPPWSTSGCAPLGSGACALPTPPSCRPSRRAIPTRRPR